LGLFNFFRSKQADNKKLETSVIKTSSKLSSGISSIILGKKRIDDDLLEELEELLITSDIGVAMADAIIESVKVERTRGVLNDPEQLINAIKDKIIEIISIDTDIGIDNDNKNNNNNDIIKPHLILVVGVNGVGKTTTIAKLAKLFKDASYKVMLVAADTFRAAAIDQLTIWSDRIGVDIIKKDEGSDPASVVFTAVSEAKRSNTDILIVDTAGRLHNKVNLMQELLKIERVAKKEIDTGFAEKLLIIDATSGQNAIIQARAFNELIGLTGLIITKLDGTAKGGVVINIINELKIPVKYIGIGEGVDDLLPFNPSQFVDAIFQQKDS